jgi:hypothetical protein
LDKDPILSIETIPVTIIQISSCPKSVFLPAKFCPSCGISSLEFILGLYVMPNCKVGSVEKAAVSLREEIF